TKLLPAAGLIGGVALAGIRGVQRVEVSTDGGRTWELAALKPQLGPNAWAVWLYHWRVEPRPAEAKLLVRATDGTGALQTAEVHEDLPNGATGYHTVKVQIGEA